MKALKHKKIFSITSKQKHTFMLFK